MDINSFPNLNELQSEKLFVLFKHFKFDEIVMLNI